MTITRHTIDRYKVTHYSRDSFSTYMIINLYEGTTNRGAIVFLRDGRGGPSPSSINSGRISLRMQEKQAAEVLETLRIETPLYLWFNDSNNVGGVGTHFEPVGEEEES